jgi:hypothetical protein
VAVVLKVASISLSCVEGPSVFVTDPTIMPVGTFRFLPCLF